MLRVTGGRWRGRKIVTPPGEATRPSMDFHRANLMNVLGQDLTGVRVLDLFAGSGAFGIECLSRGAEKAVFVEQGRDALGAIRRNLAAVAPPPGVAELIAADCYALPPLGAGFDLVFVAPPYPHFREGRARLDHLIASLAAGPAPILAADGVAIVQSDAGEFDRPPAGLVEQDRRRWGRTEFTLLARAPLSGAAGQEVPSGLR